MSNFKQVKEAYPVLADNEELKDLCKELDQSQKLANFANSEVGKYLVKKETDDCRAVLDQLMRNYTTVSHTELIGLLASFGAHWSVLLELTGAGKDADELQGVVDDRIKEIVGVG